MTREAPSRARPDTRSIEVSVTIDAPAPAVWKAITDGDAVANWFAPVASSEPGEGGSLTVSWGADSEWTSRVAVWNPNRHLRLADELPQEAVEQGAAMALDYNLEARNGTTRVSIVNSGLSADPSWDDGVRMMTNGWRVFLWNLKHYLERHPYSRRTMISERPWVSGTREQVWNTIFGDGGIGTAPAHPGDPFSLRLDDGRLLEGVVVLCDRPWAFAAMVSSLDDGVLHIEMEGTGERWRLGVWLSTYLLEEERCARIGLALGQTMSRLFPGAE